jgi:sulfur carrier protein
MPPGGTVAMRLRVNGKQQETSARTVVALLQWLDMDPGRKGIAVAVNDHVIPRSRWSEETLHENDRIEIVSAVQGG